MARIRPVLALLLAVAAPAALVACFPDSRPRISIEFGAVPELEGSKVLIDGKAVGTLDKTGEATRISWPVEPGEHEIQIESAQFACQPMKVKAELEGQKVRLMAQVAEWPSKDGRPLIVFYP